MDHPTLIKKLGGPHALHAELEKRGFELSQVAVRAWALTDRAIPAKYWTAVKSIADEKRVKVSFEALASSVAKPVECPESAAA